MRYDEDALMSQPAQEDIMEVLGFVTLAGTLLQSTSGFRVQVNPEIL